ncbi:hypothetical protein EK904_010235, partial [Melospiza melodia maxima]
CSVTCGKGMQSRVIQCMHKITGRHGNECFSSEKPAAYRPCHLHPCNEKINVNTITSPRLVNDDPSLETEVRSCFDIQMPRRPVACVLQSDKREEPLSRHEVVSTML